MHKSRSHEKLPKRPCIRALLVEDCTDDTETVRRALANDRTAQFELVHSPNLADALVRLQNESLDAILLDLTLPDGEGIDAFLSLYRQAPQLPIVVISGIDDGALAQQAMEAGAQDYLVKDRVNGEVITRVLRYAVSRKRVEEDLHQSQEQLRQAQKMEGMGRLAGGIAHDFNNLLTSILGFGTLVLNALEAESPVRQDVQEIVYSAERAKALTRQLLIFSRKELLDVQPIHLNDVVEDMDQILRRTIGEDIELVTVLGEDLGSIMADVSQLQQVIMNLAVNARDALPRGGKLLIRTERRRLEKTFCRTRPGLRPGDHVVLTVQDNGVGMTPAVRERAFEPFFTTKGKDKGTGLGLSSVYGIVKQCGGHVEIRSKPGKGCECRTFFPSAALPAEPFLQRSEQRLARGNETILLVEDEDILRRLASRILRDLGYRILEARNGSAALELVRDETGRINLVLSDVVMPQMGGPEMVARLAETRTDFKVLYMSGFTDDRVLEHGIDGRRVRLLKKPYSQAALAQFVRQVLDEEPAALAS